MQLAYDSDSSFGSENENEIQDPNDFPDDSEFNPRRTKRRRMGQSKENAALGVFGSDSEDETEGRFAGSGRKLGKKSLRYGGVSFVKTGEKTAKDKDQDREDDDSDNLEYDALNGTSAAKSGLGSGKMMDVEDDGMEDEEHDYGGGLGFKQSNSDMDVDGNNDEIHSIASKMSKNPFLFAPRALGSHTAATSGASTPRSLNGHAGLGFQSAENSKQTSPEPANDRPSFKPQSFVPRGSSARSAGIGFQAAGTMGSKELNSGPLPRAPEVDKPKKEAILNPLGQGFVSSAQKNAVLFTAFDEQDFPEEKATIRPSFTAPEPSEKPKGKGKGANATTQINTNSFAARMMAKMGHVQGQGLGRTGEGILAPIEVKLRPQGVGVGAVKEKTEQAKREERRAKELKGETLSDSDSEKERKARRQRKLQRAGSSTPASGTSTPGGGRRKPKFRTAQEISQDVKGLDIPSVLMNIIDLTGKEAKVVVSGTPGMMSAGELSKEDEDAKIAQMARRDLESFASEWKTLQAQKAAIERTNRRINSELVEQADLLKRLSDINTVIESFQTLGLTNTILDLSLTKFEDKISQLTIELERIYNMYKNELEMYDLSDIAISVFHPLVSVVLC